MEGKLTDALGPLSEDVIQSARKKYDNELDRLKSESLRGDRGMVEVRGLPYAGGDGNYQQVVGDSDHYSTHGDGSHLYKSALDSNTWYISSNYTPSTNECVAYLKTTEEIPLGKHLWTRRLHDGSWKDISLVVSIPV